MKFLPLNEPILGQAEVDAATAVIEGGFVSTAGPLVSDFETAMAERLGVAHAVATMNGTAALHLGFVALGIGPGDLVAVSDLTFIASANAAAYTGADLLLVDAEDQSWNLDGELLYDEIQRRAKAGEQLPAAIEPVHILGQPAKWEPFVVIRDEFGIPLIEDASEALGATVFTADGDRAAGALGDVGCLSFNGNKIMTTGGGGMALTDDDGLATRLRHLATQAKVNPNDYEHDEVGFNYRMPAMLAAMGIAQLARLDGFIAAKQQIRRWYDHHLAAVDGVELAPQADYARSSDWLVSASVEPDRLMPVLEHLNQHAIGARRVWRPMHLQAPYQRAEVLGGGVADAIYGKSLSLPSSASLDEDDIVRVCSELANAIR